MVIEEGMARSCAVIATPVGDIPAHIKNRVNGFLFSSVLDESVIVEEGVRYLQMLNDDRQLLKDIGTNNKQYAYQHFSIDAFNGRYQQLFKQLRGN